MNIQGLDYNSHREKLVLSEYGREIQKMVDHCMTLPDRAERLRCARTIVATMERMNPQVRQSENYKQRLWSQLAQISGFKLDIDWPVDITGANAIQEKPQAMQYPGQKIRVRHYGRIMSELFDKLKAMEPGVARDKLTALAANQMKRDLMLWGQGLSSDEKVASDLANLTDGKIQIDPAHFKFEKIDVRDLMADTNAKGGKKKKKK